MIDQLMAKVKDLPFMKRRRLWREICDVAASEKYHKNCMESFCKKKLELIREYEKLKGKPNG